MIKLSRRKKAIIIVISVLIFLSSLSVYWFGIEPRYVTDDFNYIVSKHPDIFSSDLFVPKRMADHYTDVELLNDFYRFWTFELRDKEKEAVERDVEAGKYKDTSKDKELYDDWDFFFKDNLEYDSSHEFYYISSNFFLIVYDRTAENLYFVHIDI